MEIFKMIKAYKREREIAKAYNEIIKEYPTHYGSMANNPAKIARLSRKINKLKGW